MALGLLAEKLARLYHRTYFSTSPPHARANKIARRKKRRADFLHLHYLDFGIVEQCATAGGIGERDSATHRQRLVDRAHFARRDRVENVETKRHGFAVGEFAQRERLPGFAADAIIRREFAHPAGMNVHACAHAATRKLDGEINNVAFALDKEIVHQTVHLRAIGDLVRNSFDGIVVTVREKEARKKIFRVRRQAS